MPIAVPLQQLPSQQFTITLDNNRFQLTPKLTNGQTSVSIDLNGSAILSNARAASCAPIIPEIYQESGNFIFLTANEQLPNYQQFGLTQTLYYFSAAELAVFRASPVAASPMVPTVTANYFNPFGGLPLRFKPQGYTLAP